MCPWLPYSSWLRAHAWLPYIVMYGLILSTACIVAYRYYRLMYLGLETAHACEQYNMDGGRTKGAITRERKQNLKITRIIFLVE